MDSAKVQFLGHSTVLVTSEKGKRIIIDPWLSGNPSCPKQFHDIGELDLIVLTHGHSDHAGDAVSVAKASGAKVAATYELAMLMGKEGVPEENLMPMNKGGSIFPDDDHSYAVTLTNAFHSSSFDSSDGKTYYAGEPCGVVITLESGRAIYHAGDTSLFSDMEFIRVRHKPVLALLPIGDRFTMGPADAALAANIIKPKLVIPIHYGTFDLLTGTPEEFSSKVKELSSDTKVITIAPGDTFEF